MKLSAHFHDAKNVTKLKYLKCQNTITRKLLTTVKGVFGLGQKHALPYKFFVYEV